VEAGGCGGESSRAGGIIAADMVAKSTPDGHTTLLATIALAVTPSTYRKLPYDPRDLVPLTQITAMISGEVQMGLVPVISVINHIQGGRLQPLGVTGSRRSALLPDVPTMSENGVAGFDTGSWIGLFVPAEVMARFQREVAKVVALPDIRERFAKQRV